MKKFLTLALALTFGLSVFKINDIKAEIKKYKAPKIEVVDLDENSGADSYNNSGDNPNSRYYVNPDFYLMKSDDQLLIIEKFKTMQQTNEWSCGNATALMVLNHLGLKYKSENDLALLMNSHTDLDVKNSLPGTANNFPEYGTDVKQMVEGFKKIDGIKIVETNYKEEYTDEDLLNIEDNVPENKVGNLKPTFSSMSLYTSENSDESEAYVEDAKDSYFVKWLTSHLKEGRPIMVEWADWAGHWQAIIGYDNNGTPSIGDDTLIFADPYDTSDHWQDGYYYYPLERWFYMWADLNVAAKPLQVQPYVIIDKK